MSASRVVGADTSTVAENDKPKRAAKVTAFVLDRDHVQASDDGMTVPPLPGLWRNDVAIHPEALGLTLAEMRDLVETLSLPLVEVKVSEGKAASAFPTPDYLQPSAPIPLSVGAAAPTEKPADEVAPADVDVERARIAADETDETGGDE